MSEELTFPNIDKINPQLCISSRMRKCNRIVSQIFRKRLTRFGITNSQLSILFITAKKDFVTQSILSNFLHLEKSTVSRNMRRLFENRYIKKDEKQQIKITNEGKILLEQIIPEWEKAMDEARDALKDEGVEALNLVLANLTA